MLQYVHEIKFVAGRCRRLGEPPRRVPVRAAKKNNGGKPLMSLKNIFKKKKPEDTPAFRMEMAKKIAFHRLRYVTEREGETEIVIGRDGGFNIRNGEFIVSADNRVIFRCNIKDMQASELLSKEGAILTAPDLENGGNVRTIVVYYVYFR